MKKYMIHLLSVLPVLMVLMIWCTAAAYANTYLENTGDITVTENASYSIADGVTEGDLTLTKSGGGTAEAHVLLVRANAKAKFRAVTPGYYTSGSTAAERSVKADAWKDSDWNTLGVTDMVKEYESAADTGKVLAAVNGDFGTSSTGKAPRGSLILEGNAEMAHSNVYPDEFFFGYRENGSLNIVQRITGQKSTFTEAICGAAYILRNGELFGVDNEIEARQRTGVALKPNGDTLIITVAGRDAEGISSGGITVKQLAELMQAAGCCNGINMDGGGSTTMLSRRSGESGISRRTPEISAGYSDKDANGERKVSTALMLVEDAGPANTAAASGTSITAEKPAYEIGKPITVTASSDVTAAWVGLYKTTDTPGKDASFYWYYINGSSDAGTWCWSNGETLDICTDGEANARTDLTAGTYRLIAFKGTDYSHPLAQSDDITLTDPVIDPDTRYSVKTDREVYNVGDSIKFMATAPIAETWVGIYLKEDTIPDVISFFYYDLMISDQGKWNVLNRNGGKVTEQSRSKHSIGADLTEGEYKVVLFEAYSGDGTYKIRDTAYLTIVDEKAEYSIRYMNGETEISGLAPKSYTYADASAGAVALPAEPTVEGYDFAGWYENSSLTGAPVTSIEKGSYGNRTFYGKFDKKSFKVTFDTDGGSEIGPQTVLYMDKAAQPADPEKDGYIFTGWVTKKGGSEKFSFDKGITGDTVVYGDWRPESGYAVSFDTDGGSEITDQGVQPGGKAARPADPVKTGYIFSGWYTTAEHDAEFDFSTEITGPLTIYAAWNPAEYTITYELNGGTNNSANPDSYTIETETVTLAPPEREGYTFTGWTDADGNQVGTIDKGSSGDICLTAGWKHNDELSTDKTKYIEGQPIYVTAYSDNEDAWVGLYKESDVPGSGEGTATSFYYYYVKQSVTYPDGTYVENGAKFNILSGSSNSRTDFGPGNYKVILFGDSGYSMQLLTRTITVTENADPAEGSITLTGWSRDDKTYSGKATARRGAEMYDFYYGDAIEVTVNRTGGSADSWNGVWTGIITDDDMNAGATAATVDHRWINISDITETSVNLNYIYNDGSGLSTRYNRRMPYGLNYWAVLVDGAGKILDAVPFNYRTFNMDWNNNTWGKAVSAKLSAETSWSSIVADGSDHSPEVVLRRINGHFGWNEAGEEITEEVLTQGEEYTITCPAASSEPGVYTITVAFPSAQPADGDKYNYLSTNPENYGLSAGITYTIKEDANDHAVSYVLEGGTNNPDNPEFYRTGTALTLKAPARAGYIFDGWYTTASFSAGTEITEIAADSAEDITVYAKWISETTDDETTYSISYVLNGGDNDVNNPLRYTGKTQVSLLPAKRANYTFAGWYFDAEFTSPADTIAAGTTGDLTVYAKFSAKTSATYRITTDVTCGTISASSIVREGSSCTVTYEANSGYVLKKIMIDGVAADISSYKNSYTFTDISSDHTITVTYAKKAAAPAVQTVRAGDKFRISSNTYKVISVKSGTVAFVKAKNAKSVTVPATVKIKGKSYKVTRIDAEAFTAKKIRTVTIGKNVKKIVKNAFKSSKATKIILKTRLLTKARVAGSLKNSAVKTMQVKVGTAKKTNRTYMNKYKKIFTKKNAGRKVTVKL